MIKNKHRRNLLIKFFTVFSIIFAVGISLIITNIYVPVRYISAYLHIKKDLIEQGEMRVRYLDVGFGDCTIVELPDGKILLIDGGNGTYSNIHTILDFLNVSGIDKIDYLVCTSVKSEHCGGLCEIVKYKQVECAFVPYVTNINITDEFYRFYKQLLKEGADIQIAEYGNGAYDTASGYYFGFLSPMKHIFGDSEYTAMNAEPEESNINDASAVMWLEYRGSGFMFLGDTGYNQQNKIASEIAIEKRNIVVNGTDFKMNACKMLKVSNHCYTDSVQEYLLDLISPEAAIITYGEGTTGQVSLKDYAKLQIYLKDNIYRTDVNGTVTVIADLEGTAVSKEKQ